MSDRAPRVYTATFITETNTFSPIPTSSASFVRGTSGREMWERALRPLASRGAEFFGTFDASAEPSARISRLAYEALRDELLDEVRAAMPLDYVVLSLHGAMVAYGYDDCEGDILARIRAMVGDETAIGATLDPHCHLSDAMVDAADLLITFKEYPHTDAGDRLVELVEKLVEMEEASIELVRRVYDVRTIALYHTDSQPMRDFVDRLFELERKGRFFSISLAHGFPWGDVPQMGTKLLTYAAPGDTRADDTAQSLVQNLRSLRGRTAEPLVPYEEAIDIALSSTGPTVLADCADNPGGGAPGDSTFLLRALMEKEARNVALGPLWDPMAVEFAMLSGAGSTVELRLGGKAGTASGAPLDVIAVVAAIEPDYSIDVFGVLEQKLGATVRLVIDGSIDVVVTSERSQAYTRSLFERIGITLGDKQTIVVKSSHHFKADFSAIAQRLIHTSSPGALNMDFKAIPYRSITRPIWPLDPV